MSLTPKPKEQAWVEAKLDGGIFFRLFQPSDGSVIVSFNSLGSSSSFHLKTGDILRIQTACAEFLAEVAVKEGV
jgi:hypothetical protein